MIANIKFELWYLDSEEMLRLLTAEQLQGLGAVVQIMVYLRRQHHAIGHRNTLGKVARDCGCDQSWLWHIVTDFGLFNVCADGSFYSPYQRQSLGMTAHPDDPAPSRTHRRRRALYSKDSIDSKDRKNRQNATACVCLDDTQQSVGDGALDVTDYRCYEKYLKR